MRAAICAKGKSADGHSLAQRTVLTGGPLLAAFDWLGSVVAGGSARGSAALGLGIEHSFFFIVVQIMAVHERRYNNRDRSDAASTRAWPQYPKFDSLACQFVIDCAFLLAR
jgi:hypothetical protein